MKISNGIGSMEVCGRFPRVVADAVALPLDEVVESATYDPAVKHLFDFELFVVIDDLGWRGRSRVTTRERIRRREGELDNGEDGMEAMHGEGEFELVGSMTDTQSDFEGPETSMG